MPWRKVCLLSVVVLAVLAAAVSPLQAAPTEAQRAQLKVMWDGLKQAGDLYRGGKLKESQAALEKVQKQYNDFDDKGDPQLQSILDRVYKSLSGAHATLELDGIILTPLVKRGAPAEEMAPPEKTVGTKPTPAPTTPAPAVPATGVSFSKDVAPILIAKCGRCHVNDSKGRFNLGSYAALMRGSADGKVIFEGDGAGSRFIEVIESGDMPRGGLSVTAAELATLKKWITEGAKNDGPAGDTPLAALAMSVKPAEVAPPPMVASVKPTKEGVSFGRDVAGILAENCMGCHGTNNPRMNFSLANFQSLLKGGDSGPPIVPGKPGDSLLIKKLKGEGGGQRMPLNSPALPDETIAKIAEWIAKGAAFDGPNATTPLNRVAALVKANTATHEELAAEREVIAMRNWKLSLPGVESKSVTTENFLVMGNVGEATLGDLGKSAEAVAPKVAQLFKAPADKPLIKGKLTLFAFPVRYDYSEFGQMVERRKLPQQWSGHWMFDGVDAYGALIPPRGESFSSEALIGQQLAAVYVSAQGTVPNWFAEGTGRAVAAKLAATDPRVKQWNDALPEALGSMQQADDFMTGKMNEEDAMLAAYSFVGALMKDAAKYQKVLTALRAGQEFDKAFAAGYGGTPAQAAQGWAARASRGR